MIKGIGAATAWQLISLFVTVGDRVVVSSLLVRHWGVAAFEDWSVLFAVANFVGLLDFGLHMTFSNSLSLARRDGDLALYRRLLGVALLFACAIVLVGSLASGVIAALLNNTTFVTTTIITGWDGKAVALALSLAIVLQTSAFVATAVYRADERFARSVAASTVFGLVRTLSMGVLAASGLGPVVVAIVYLIETALFVVIFLPFDVAWRRAGNRVGPVRPNSRELGEITSKSAYFGIQQICQIALMSMPLVVLARTSALNSEVAIFVWLRLLMNSVRQVTNALANSIGIELARVESEARLRADLTRYTRVICLVNATLLGIAFSLGEPLVHLWSGGRLTYDSNMALIFVLGFLISGPFIVINNYLSYINNARIGAQSRLLSLGVFAVTALAFSGSMTGVVAGLSIGEAVTSGLFFLPALARSCGTSALRLGLLLAGYSLFGFGLVTAAGMLASALQPLSPIVDFVSHATIVGVAAVLATVLFGLSKGDRANLWRRSLYAVGASSPK